MKKEHVYTVSGINRHIRSVLEDNFGFLSVEGEVSNLSAPSSGHLYFSLKDANSSIRCVVFKGAIYRMSSSVKIEDGMSVLCSGKIGVYEKQGQYQIYVENIEPRGIGSLHVAFEKLKDKLSKEGMFDTARKKDIPVLPARVAAVTSSTGAAIKDILKVAKRRFSNIEITIFPVKVQGYGAKEEIAGAIKAANEYNAYLKDTLSEQHLIDAIIVGRGGGSMEDLWAFNEEIVARAIADSDIPVVSAVGHEIDFTISDFVSDLRAATPSAAAEILIPEKKDLIRHLDGIYDRILKEARGKIERCSDKLSALSENYILREPINMFLQLEQQIDDILSRENIAMDKRLTEYENTIDTLEGRVKALNPRSVLARGYSITYKGGKIVKNKSSVSSGDNVVTRLADGEFDSVVK